MQTFYNVPQTAKLAGVSPATVRKALKSGELKGWRRFNTPNGHIAITAADAKTFADSRKNLSVA